MNEWIRQKAPAKINLNLHVLGQRQDGYHRLQSLVVFSQLADVVQARPADHNRLEIGGPFASQLAEGPDNLVLQTIDLFRQTWPAGLPRALDVRLAKNLPVSAGLGGGSSDAAAMLRVLQQFSPVSIPSNKLHRLAARLGADVPVCLVHTPQIMHGTGEELIAAPQLPGLEMVLINPLIAVSTPKVFAALKQKNHAPLPTMPETFSGAKELMRWLRDTRNDLYAPAINLVPEIAQTADFLASQPGCVLARMSGSGATVFGIFETAEQAMKASLTARQNWPGYWVEHTRTRAHSSD